MIEKRLRHTRIYEQVVNELKELIASGELLPGDKPAGELEAGAPQASEQQDADLVQTV